MNYRKTSKAIHDGKTIHFAPKDGLYVLCRILHDEIVMIILNKSDKEVFDTSMVEELGLDGKMVKDIISGDEFSFKGKTPINVKGVTLITTKLK